MQKLTFVSVLLSLIMMTPIVTTIVQAADIETSGSCTLADAIIAANNDRAKGGCPAGRGSDTITLSQDITLDGRLPKITSDITIEGNGFTISGNNRYRIFYNNGGALTINNLTMTKGYVEGDIIRNADESLKNTPANPIGGAIVNWQGTLTISNSSFSDNLADNDGGAIYNIANGTLSISDSSFSDNSAEANGGAIYNWGESELSISDSSFSNNSAWLGGTIYNQGGELSISDSAFSDNSAEYLGGAIYNWGESELSISDSSFSNNSAEYRGVRISLGGAISNEHDGELSIVNSAFSGNSADKGGAIHNGDYGELSITNSAFSNNSADKSGGAIYNGEDGKLRITNSIIAGNGGACYSESRLRHNISNFIQDGSCDPAFSGDPMLGELVEPEDGSPAYYPLLEGSPAIDAADDEYCPDTDMLGTVRPQGAACDIGAYERPQ